MPTFQDKVHPKQKEKSMKSPWNFDAPCYDERTSCFVSAGTNHGVGKNQPIGSLNHKADSSVIPKGRVDTMNVYPGKSREIIQDQK